MIYWEVRKANVPYNDDMYLGQWKDDTCSAAKSSTKWRKIGYGFHMQHRGAIGGALGPIDRSSLIVVPSVIDSSGNNHQLLDTPLDY